MKRWTIVFKALGNINRLKIIVLLSGSEPKTVSEIAEQLRISQKAISKHLIHLQRLDVLDSEGRYGHVFYSLNKNMPEDFKKAARLFLR